MNLLHTFIIIVVVVFVLFLPGAAISLSILKRVSFIERIFLSIAISLAIVPLLVFFLSLVGVPINKESIIIEVLLLILIGLLLYFLKKDEI